MISGECRVEPIGLSSGHQLALDGLRLRLDLRIVAATAADGSAEAVWRVEDGRIRTLSLNVPAVYRRAAMLAGIGALAVALLVWFAGSRAPSEAQGPTLAPGAPGARETDGLASSAPRSSGAGASAAAAPSVGAAGDAASAASPDRGDVAPRVAPLAPAAQPPAPVSVEPAAPAAPAAAGTVRPSPSQPARPRPSAPSPALTNREMLDLFSDPK